MTHQKLVVDADVLIDYLRGRPEALDFVGRQQGAIVLSAITVGELYSGVREGAERGALDRLISAVQVVPIDTEIGQRAGLIRRDFGKSHGTGLADALVAATANSIQARLVTLNLKHYPMCPDALVPYRKSA